MAKDQVKQKQTSEVLQKLDEVFALDGTIEEACYYANIAQATYYLWVKDSPELLERFTRLRNRPILKARQTIIRALDNPKDAQWYLERKKKIEFATRQEMTGAEGRELTIQLSEVIANKNAPDTSTDSNSQ